MQQAEGNREQQDAQQTAGLPEQRDRNDPGMGEKQEQQRLGAKGDMQQQAGMVGKKTDAATLHDSTGMMEAVEKFDQLGEQQHDDGAEHDTGMPMPGGRQGSTYMMLVEQQLDAIEGDPVQLLHNRFRLEEQRRLQTQRPGARIYEPRPW